MRPAGGSSSVATDQIMEGLGHLGRFHVVNYILLALPVLSAATYSITYVFLAADVNYR